ncbi:MAG: UbiA family prenyltransferase [Candidatus Nanohalobium sp.]
MRRSKITRNDLLFLLKLGRPIGIPLMSLVILAGAASESGITPVLVLKTVFISAIISYVGFGANDYIDRETDKQNPRKGGWQGTTATGRRSEIAKYATMASVIISTAVSLTLGVTAAASLIGITVLALMYSLPPTRLKSAPVLDSLSNVVMAYLAFSLGVGLAGGTFDSVIGGAFWFSLVFAGGGHAIGSLLDLEPDRKAGITTTGTFLGWKKTLAVIQAFTISALIFEKWSVESRTFLIILFLGLLAPAYREKREILQKTVYIGLITYVIYGFIWLILRT